MKHYRLLLFVWLFMACASTTAQYIIQPIQQPETPNIAIQWFITAKQIAFEITNLDKQPIEIVWDKCAYIDPDGITHAVMHSGVKYISKDRPQTPTIIIPNAKLRDVIVPKDYIYFAGSTWIVYPLFPTSDFQGLIAPERLKHHPSTYKGKEFKVVLTIKQGDQEFPLIYTFQITDVLLESQ